MKKALNWLDGRKTYLGIIAGALYSLAIAVGWTESDEVVWTAIATWTGVSFRAALNK